MSEEEFGISSHQPIVFPFDSSVMDHIIRVLLQQKQSLMFIRSFLIV
ncbi:hypothetical protein LINPERHAP2_LOCUS39672 [Linum perenne]